MPKDAQVAYRAAKAAIESLNVALGAESYEFELRVGPPRAAADAHICFAELISHAHELDRRLGTTFNSTPVWAAPGEDIEVVGQRWEKDRAECQRVLRGLGA